MDKGKEEVSKSLERSNNSKKKKIMEKTSDDQKDELYDQMEQAPRKRFKTETTTHYPQRLKLSAGSLKNNPKFGMDKETDSEETDEEPSVISLAGSSTNNPKGPRMKTTKEILRELKKKSKSNSCTSTILTYPTDKFPDSDKDESKRSPPAVQCSRCRKNL